MLEQVDAIFQGQPELAGLKAVAAMQRLSGHPGVALLHDTRTSTNVMLIAPRKGCSGSGPPHPLISLAPESRAGVFPAQNANEGEHHGQQAATG
jgi:hypothetical protein